MNHSQSWLIKIQTNPKAPVYNKNHSFYHLYRPKYVFLFLNHAVCLLGWARGKDSFEGLVFWGFMFAAHPPFILNTPVQRNPWFFWSGISTFHWDHELRVFNIGGWDSYPNFMNTYLNCVMVGQHGSFQPIQEQQKLEKLWFAVDCYLNDWTSTGDPTRSPWYRRCKLSRQMDGRFHPESLCFSCWTNSQDSAFLLVKFALFGRLIFCVIPVFFLWEYEVFSGFSTLSFGQTTLFVHSP